VRCNLTHNWRQGKARTAAGLKCLIMPSRLTAGRPFAGAHRVLNDIREVLTVV
jgi:hypothetical protein